MQDLCPLTKVRIGLKDRGFWTVKHNLHFIDISQMFFFLLKRSGTFSLHTEYVTMKN